MLTSILATAPFFLLVALVYARLVQRRGAAFAHYCAFWVPPVVFSLMWGFPRAVGQIFSYGGIVVLLMLVLLSLGAGCQGLVLVLRAYRRGEAWRALLITTLFASAPVMLAAVAVVRHR